MLKRKIGVIILIIVLGGMAIPQEFTMPVDGATQQSYNKKSFWYYPWGKSVTHKGVDIFAKKGTTVRSSTGGLVLYCGQIAMGGNVVLILGPKWRLHYFAHMNAINTSKFTWADRGEVIGTVGSSGNAVGKPPHLHYSIMTFIPNPMRIDSGRHGLRKMFYLNPIDFLN